MDLTSSVRTDALPALGSLLVPGALAAAPYIALAWGEPHNLKAFVAAQEAASTAAGFLVIAASGFLIESIGSYVEYYVIDWRHEDRAGMLDRWRRFLRVAWTTEPIGQRYLRRILTVFKFELNLLVATVATLPGLWALWHYGLLTPRQAITLQVLAVGLILYLLRATFDSSKLLDELRAELVATAALH
jgi:hypothetical protein